VEDLKLAREDGHDGIVNLLESLSRSVKDLSENYEATKLLWWAVMKEKHDLLEALVQKGADLNSEKQFTYPRTPLGWAVENDRRDMFFHLSLLGADPCQNNWRDDTAISLAMEKQRTNWVTSMLESVPNLDILINREHYILTYAASKRNCEVIEWLLDNGASVDVRSSVGLTALSYVAQTGDVQTAKLLLDHGADLESRGGYVNRTPLEWASERLMKDFLVKRSADKGATDKYNMGAY
jgi:ankyrin repeat protein